MALSPRTVVSWSEKMRAAAGVFIVARYMDGNVITQYGLHTVEADGFCHTLGLCPGQELEQFLPALGAGSKRKEPLWAMPLDVQDWADDNCIPIEWKREFAGSHVWVWHTEALAEICEVWIAIRDERWARYTSGPVTK